ncbi:hypothetical protein UA08_01365 [Talaromyces atroroseus]|uniref:Uncharacterized protein n=1 Tax=Talaromyces atroroseus TaxID=1441469 RepID=A0A1Q5QAD3_TALAT|nr:hypothetical protein UA08_01365 [Talaromyces atroroseus]OKL62719.1 hypothetical protein UA08_01365 [Talaromyces atroroseus]
MDNVASVIDVLSSGRINTLTDLCRMERTLINAMQPRVENLRESPAIELMASAWTNYVQSNNLLNELRNLTRDYPFSSELLDDAKELVMRDPNRKRSWNYAWLVLTKIEEDALVEKHAKALSTNPEMWGGSLPPEEMTVLLENKCREDWTRAVRIMLRHWQLKPLFQLRGKTTST